MADDAPSSSQASQPLRIGFLGTARISRKNAGAILHPSSSCTVTAIASRSEERAKDFVAKWLKSENVTIIGGDSAYDDLVASTGLVDVLYIPLPTILHKEWVIKALENGKHVIIEKPVALSASDYKQMQSVAYRSKKYLQDGTMFVHHQRTADFLKTVSDENGIGKVTRINMSFTFLGDDDFFKNDIRTKKDGDPLGCIGDLGWYCVRMAVLVFSQQGAGQATSVQVVHVKENEEGVPLDVTCLVHFSKDRVAFFHCSFLHPLRQRIEVCGSKQAAIMEDFVLPQAGTNHFELHNQWLTELDKVTVHKNETIACTSDPPQVVLMWKNFANIARSIDDISDSKETVPHDSSVHDGWAGDTELIREANVVAAQSLETQRVLDALMESIKRNGEEIAL